MQKLVYFPSSTNLNRAKKFSAYAQQNIGRMKTKKSTNARFTLFGGDFQTNRDYCSKTLIESQNVWSLFTSSGL